MNTLKLEPSTGDWAIVDGRFVVETRFAYALTLHIGHALSLVLGEFGLATDEGFPYFGIVLGVKSPDLGAIRSRFISYIQALSGVATVAKLDAVFDGKTRALSFNGVVLGDDGSRIEFLNGQVYVNGERV